MTGGQADPGPRAPFIVRLCVFATLAMPLGCATIAVTWLAAFLVGALLLATVDPEGHAAPLVMVAAMLLGSLLAVGVLVRLVRRPPGRLRGLLPRPDELRVSPWWPWFWS